MVDRPKRIPRNPDAAFELGVKTGTKITKQEALDELRTEVLGFLEQKYMADDAPERGTAEANGILDLTRELSALLGGPSK